MTPAAARARRYRRRLRDNRAILLVEVDLFAVTDGLIEAGFIREEHSEDRQQLAAAAARLLDGWAKSVTRDGSGPVRRATLGPC